MPQRSSGEGAAARHGGGAAWWLAWIPLGCGPQPEPPAVSFELEQVSPDFAEPALNQALTFHFSEPVSPSSVTRESLRIRDEVGRDASGSFRVDGKRVEFLPDPVLSAELDDGGLRPGTGYVVEALGFPHPDGIRADDGRPLRCTFRWSFRTAQRSDSPREMFRDRTLGYAERLRLAGARNAGGLLEVSLLPGEPLVLECGEPVYPPSVRTELFRLDRVVPGGIQPIPLDVRLVENFDRGDPFPRGTARIELRPLVEPRAGSYFLHLTAAGEPTDLGGNALPGFRTPTEIRIVTPEERLGVHEEHFLDVDRRSTLAVRAVPAERRGATRRVDGSAFWGGDGVVTVRFPAAAGDGSDGLVEDLAAGEWARAKDVQAVRLGLPAGRDCELAASGLIVLRAQGEVRLQGRLARGGGPGPELAWRRGERLSTWLERALEEDPAWTVIVAGGDLIIEGEIETEGPLLLVAGGWIRATGRVQAQERQTWLLGEGGGRRLDPTRSSPQLELDPPRLNPLVEPLTFAVLSEPLPATGGVTRWVHALARGVDNGGRWRVRYVPADAPHSRGDWTSRIVDHPALIEPPGKLRLLVELRVDPPQQGSYAWDPPLVDEVHLRWERPEREDQR